MDAGIDVGSKENGLCDDKCRQERSVAFKVFELVFHKSVGVVAIQPVELRRICRRQEWESRWMGTISDWEEPCSLRKNEMLNSTALLRINGH